MSNGGLLEVVLGNTEVEIKARDKYTAKLEKEIKEQEIRDIGKKETESETPPEELTVEQRLENAEKRIEKQEQTKQAEDYRTQTLTTLNRLNEKHDLPPKAKKLVDMQTVAMLRGGSTDLSTEHNNAVLLFKEAIEEYNEQLKNKATANHKTKVFIDAGAGLKSGGGLSRIEPDESKTADHVTSGAAYDVMAGLLREMKES